MRTVGCSVSVQVVGLSTLDMATLTKISILSAWVLVWAERQKALPGDPQGDQSGLSEN